MSGFADDVLGEDLRKAREEVDVGEGDVRARSCVISAAFLACWDFSAVLSFFVSASWRRSVWIDSGVAELSRMGS